MDLPDFIRYGSLTEYRQRFEDIYCGGPVITFDGIAVRFRKDDFGHCFYERSMRTGPKDVFSNERAIRIDWIKAVLESPDADLRTGWTVSVSGMIVPDGLLWSAGTT